MWTDSANRVQRRQRFVRGWRGLLRATCSAASPAMTCESARDARPISRRSTPGGLEPCRRVSAGPRDERSSITAAMSRSAPRQTPVRFEAGGEGRAPGCPYQRRGPDVFPRPPRASRVARLISPLRSGQATRIPVAPRFGAFRDPLGAARRSQARCATSRARARLTRLFTVPVWQPITSAAAS